MLKFITSFGPASLNCFLFWVIASIITFLAYCSISFHLLTSSVLNRIFHSYAFTIDCNIVRPRFAVPIKRYHNGYEGWDTTLTCDIFGYPTPLITWTRATVPMPRGRHVIAGKDLIIKKTRPEDAGPFMCRGSSKLGTILALIMLFVKPVGKPMICFVSF